MVIGGGVIGVCCAYYLARSGRTVALMEKGEIARGCSYGNACLITPSHAVPLPAPGVVAQALRWMFKEDSPLLIRARPDIRLFGWMLRFARYCTAAHVERGIPVLRDLCRASLDLFLELARAENLQFHFERRGSLYVNSTDAGFEKNRQTAALLTRYGFESRVLTGREAHALEPALVENLPGAVYYPEDAHGDSYLFVTCMADLLPRLGVALHTETSLKGFTAGKNGLSVVTTRGTFSTKDVVLAAGSWTPQLAQPLGVDVPIQPGKGYSVTIRKPECSPLIPVTHQEKKVLATPIGNRLRFAGTMEFAGMDLRMNDVRADAALRGAREILQPIGEPQDVERWCGLRPCTPDGIPIIGRLPQQPNVYIACGHGMLGYTMGPITGKIVSEMIAGKKVSFPEEPLSLGRF
jgi:D-amino-acid dehydrogenase